MKKKKILQICAIDGSVNVLLKPLILESMANGYEVHNACSNTGKFEQLSAEGLIMKDINIDRKISPLSNLKSIYKIYRLILKEKYDIVHVHTPIAALLGRIAAKLAGTKNIIYTAHGFYFHDDMPEKQYNLFFKIEKYAAKWMTDWLLLQSREDYELARDKNFKEHNRILHISNGVDIWNKFNNNLIKETETIRIKRDLNIHEGEIVLSFIGRLVKEKGVFELVEAFKRVVVKYPNAKLLVIGGMLKGERDSESYNNLLKDLEHPNISYLGIRKDIPELMSISDCFILPSHREGLPRSIIEAMAMSTPIIASNIRGCREEVFTGENGFLFEKKNIFDLENALETIISNNELRKQFGLRSREIVEELFDESLVLKKQIDLFDYITVSKKENPKGKLSKSESN